MSPDDDRKLLRECLAEWDERPERDIDEPNWRAPFQRMADDLDSGKWLRLTEKQSAWVAGVHEKLFDAPKYLNLHSAGKVPRGLREVATPEVLTRRPLKPPGGRA
jgi:hypothetical protein